MSNIEIICSECGADALVRREPEYDGFKKVGELFFCSACGYQYASEDDVPFKEKKKKSVFTDADRSEKLNVFKEDERGKNCRYCMHYVVNPFAQRCELHKKFIEATDLCDDFEKCE
jgi:hypothetical protein